MDVCWLGWRGTVLLISPLEGEMAGKPKGGILCPDAKRSQSEDNPHFIPHPAFISSTTVGQSSDTVGWIGTAHRRVS